MVLLKYISMQNETKKLDTFKFYLGPKSSSFKENNRNQKELHFKELKF